MDRENSPKPHPAILSVSARNAYYAGGTHVYMYGINDVPLVGQVRKADYIMITQRDYEVIEKEMQQFVKSGQIALAYKFPERNSLNKRIVLLYEVLH